MVAHKILVIDDEKEILNVFTLVLESHGYSVCTAGTAAEGLAKSRSFHPDLTLLDVRLPDMHGTVLPDMLRGLDPRQIIVIMTGEPELIPPGHGADMCLLKPFEPDYLVEAIRMKFREQDACGVADPDLQEAYRKPALTA